MSLKAPEPPKQQDEMDDAVAQLKDSYGTKIDSVVQCIKETLKEKPEDKVWTINHTAAVCDILSSLVSQNVSSHRFRFQQPTQVCARLMVWCN